MAMKPQLLPLRALLGGDVVQAAAGLVGCVLARRLADGRIRRALIVETEAYHQRERGCHAYNGKTLRNATMFGQPGQLYVYFTYGMWYCANIVCEPAGTAAAVLLRAAQPLPQQDISSGDNPPKLSGPGLLCQGMQLTRDDNGANVLGRRDGVWLYRPCTWDAPPLARSTRIGFSFPDTHRWRCYWDGHPAVSKGRPGAVVKRKRGK